MCLAGVKWIAPGAHFRWMQPFGIDSMGLISNPTTYSNEWALLKGWCARSISQGDTLPMEQSAHTLLSFSQLVRDSKSTNQFTGFLLQFSYARGPLWGHWESLKNCTDGISISSGVKQHKKLPSLCVCSLRCQKRLAVASVDFGRTERAAIKFVSIPSTHLGGLSQIWTIEQRLSEREVSHLSLPEKRQPVKKGTPRSWCGAEIMSCRVHALFPSAQTREKAGNSPAAPSLFAFCPTPRSPRKRNVSLRPQPGG